MTPIDRFLPSPKLHEIDYVDVGVPAMTAWEYVRHVDFARSPIVRALFALRTAPERTAGKAVTSTSMRIDDLVAGKSGFRILDEQVGSSVTVGAIGKVWRPDITFAAVLIDQYADFNEPGWVKVAWELRCEPRGSTVTRLTIDLRVTATDTTSWYQFRRYFLLIGPFSHFIRRHLLGRATRELGSAEDAEQHQWLPGDELLPDADVQLTHGVTIEASPGDIWPWLVQMGCQRAGWYSYDLLDNAGEESAREIVPTLQSIHVGEVLPWRPDSNEGFEVIQIAPPRAMVISASVNVETNRRFRFADPRPAHYFQTTWAFVLEPIDGSTRLHVRVRASFSHHGMTTQARMLVMRAIHHFMETAQLRNLRQRVEGSRRSAQAYR